MNETITITTASNLVAVISTHYTPRMRNKVRAALMKGMKIPVAKEGEEVLNEPQMQELDGEALEKRDTALIETLVKSLKIPNPEAEPITNPTAIANYLLDEVTVKDYDEIVKALREIDEGTFTKSE